MPRPKPSAQPIRNPSSLRFLLLCPDTPKNCQQTPRQSRTHRNISNVNADQNSNKSTTFVSPFCDADQRAKLLHVGNARRLDCRRAALLGYKISQAFAAKSRPPYLHVFPQPLGHANHAVRKDNNEQDDERAEAHISELSKIAQLLVH